MTEQRLVPVELLNDCLREAGYVENFGLVARIRDIIDGQGIKPVSVFAYRRKGLDYFCTCDEDRHNELAQKPSLFEVAVFYTAPQQPAK